MAIKVLFWGDAPAPLIHTGFGIVSGQILKALHNTGLYEIDVLGINYFGSFFDKQQTPYHVTPAKLLDPQDPYGNRMLLKSLSEKKYDILFVINDTYVTHGIANKIQEYKTKYNQNLKIIYYYPVDCTVSKDSADMINIADKPVTYTNFAKKETLKKLPHLESNLDVIYHGTDVDTYCPLSVDKINQARMSFFGILPEDKTFVWMNVNRNSVRKNLPKTIYCFNRWKQAHKDVKTLLYLHTVPNDQGIDLQVCLQELNLSMKTDVIFPVNYSPANAFSGEVLNQFYNASDCFLSTSLGEGWGIGQCEAMAAGIPLIAPNNTSTPEIIGPWNEKSGYCERGIDYQCEESVFIDNQGYREDGRIEEIVNSMDKIYNINPITKITMLQAARKFTVENSWTNINKKWVELFDRIVHSDSIPRTIQTESL